MVKNRSRALKEAEMRESAALKKAERAAKKGYRKAQDRARGRQTLDEDAQFEAALRELGLRFLSIEGDGNCLFRSLADQDQGRAGAHSEVRRRVVEHMAAHREDFEPFMEDDEPFDAYLRRMGRDGEWGGHQELFAASRLLRATVVVHQFNAPRFELTFEGAGRTLHLSYHGEMHYNSVRGLDDPALPNKPAAPITLRALRAAPPLPGGGGAGAVAQVSRAVPSASPEVVRRTLRDAGGDVDAAVELLVSGYEPPPSDDEVEPVPGRGGSGGSDGGSSGRSGRDEVEVEAISAAEAAAAEAGAEVSAEAGAEARTASDSCSALSKGRAAKAASRGPPRSDNCPCSSGKK